MVASISGQRHRRVAAARSQRPRAQLVTVRGGHLRDLRPRPLLRSPARSRRRDGGGRIGRGRGPRRRGHGAHGLRLLQLEGRCLTGDHRLAGTRARPLASWSSGASQRRAPDAVVAHRPVYRLREARAHHLRVDCAGAVVVADAPRDGRRRLDGGRPARAELRHELAPLAQRPGQQLRQIDSAARHRRRQQQRCVGPVLAGRLLDDAAVSTRICPRADA